ncbi:3-hydroxybutyryl-CoA dehydratase [Propionivibrio dicarboxylicus]|uniref:3-hydroxybutyryl-CoA dehydratase n=2 Tax=Propionivibrio dicarboxylicus TaxID=83767 RepID=A0A1G8IYK4_9RHOO|nr:3-hydroxybutyryl-CoA dehydratase [Propionivibrio dicarboxylicus]
MDAHIGKTVAEIRVGEEAYFAKTMTETDMMLFAGITGDLNQLPINGEFARGSRYGQRVAHGMLTASFVTNILGMKLPGFGTLLRSFKVRFTAPVFLDDTVEIGVRVSATDLAGNTATFETWAVNQRGETVMRGSCVVTPPTALAPA